jgi:hypothetical protein
MVTIMVMALMFTAQDSAGRHIRTEDARILALIDAGLSGSAAFRQLVATLDQSDVIVYVEPKVMHDALGGYLLDDVTVAGSYRYLHVKVDVGGSKIRLIAVLAHELQHAIEVAQSAYARDAAGVREAFRRRAYEFGCAKTDCYETRAAVQAQERVLEELKAAVTASAKPAN